jgi:hypothetical protein
MERPPPARAHAADSRTSHDTKNTATKTAEILINLFVPELTLSSPVELFAMLKSNPEMFNSHETEPNQQPKQCQANPEPEPDEPRPGLTFERVAGTLSGAFFLGLALEAKREIVGDRIQPEAASGMAHPLLARGHALWTALRLNP